eukprot:c21717_g1_i1 orf=199-1581(-)
MDVAEGFLESKILPFAAAALVITVGIAFLMEGFLESTILSFAVAALVIIAGVAFLMVQNWRHSCANLQIKIGELQAALETAQLQRAAERKGRIRAQQALRKALVEKDLTKSDMMVYPMIPIGIIHSCFSTRNGTPRQPLLVPLARACLTLSAGGVPPIAFEGLEGYSHCWLLYIFHANTDLPHLWMQPTHQDFKAKVRVPRLDGAKLGVYATRTPHRPCPIGLTVAKVEGVHGRMLFLSGIDLVDGTPVLDVKPYLPYCDSIPDAQTPQWAKADYAEDPLALASVEFSKGFPADLSKCWAVTSKHSMYSGPKEFQKLIRQVLTRDIRSLNQRHKPHNSTMIVFHESHVTTGDIETFLSGSETTEDDNAKCDGYVDGGKFNATTAGAPFEMQLTTGFKRPTSDFNYDDIIYHMILEGIKIDYSVDCGKVVIRSAELSHIWSAAIPECNYALWAKVVGSLSK